METGCPSLVARLLLRGKATSVQKTSTESVDNQQECAMDLSAGSDKYPLSKSEDEMGQTSGDNDEPIESLRCGICHFAAANIQELFRHKKYCHHHQSRSNRASPAIMPSTSMTVFNGKVRGDHDPTANPGCSDSPSLRELLKKKEQNISGPTYLRSVVRAVMGDKNKPQPTILNQLASDHSLKHSYQVQERQRPLKGKKDFESNEQVLNKEVQENMWNLGKVNTSIANGETLACHLDVNVKEEPSWDGYTSQNSLIECDSNALTAYRDVSKTETHHNHKRKRTFNNISDSTQNKPCMNSISQENETSQIRQDYSVYHTKYKSKSTRTVTLENKATQCEIVDSCQTVIEDRCKTCLSSKENSCPPEKYGHACQYCDIYFQDEVLHSIHMGCHNLKDPFLCNVCGRYCEDKYGFYTHIMRGHQQSA